ncbi:MAG: acetate--CoA ligase family protein [Chloroflexi bacterium]|nr:acetate--CoA ligase family protein [Chloroflexota bacterium]
MTIGAVLADCQRQGRTFLLEPEAKRVLSLAGIPTTDCLVASTLEEVLQAAEAIGYPVVLKVLSSQIVHKTDIGGVKLNLRNKNELEQAYRDLKQAVERVDPTAEVIVQKMAESGTEVIVGMSTEAQFGPILMFGLGGIFTEILKDVCFRLIPITPQDAAEMITAIRAYPLLRGYRGVAADLAAISDILLKVSQLATDYPQISELDLNPIVIYETGALVLDARIGLRPINPEIGL